MLPREMLQTRALRRRTMRRSERKGTSVLSQMMRRTEAASRRQTTGEILRSPNDGVRPKADGGFLSWIT